MAAEGGQRCLRRSGPCPICGAADEGTCNLDGPRRRAAGRVRRSTANTDVRTSKSCLKPSWRFTGLRSGVASRVLAVEGLSSWTADRCGDSGVYTGTEADHEGFAVATLSGLLKLAGAASVLYIYIYIPLVQFSCCSGRMETRRVVLHSGELRSRQFQQRLGNHLDSGGYQLSRSRLQTPTSGGP